MDICLLCVFYSKNKRHSQDNEDKEVVEMKYREQKNKKKSRGGGGGHVYLSRLTILCCQVEVFAMGRSLVQRSPTACGVSLCVMYKRQEWEWVGGSEGENACKIFVRNSLRRQISWIL
jgi:hypothetical protein